MLSILYHDVTDPQNYDSSGFPGPAAAHYKLAWRDFEEHLDAINAVLQSPPVTISHPLTGPTQELKFLLTFDDGGISNLRIAERLEKFGWRAHFFITTDCIGRAGFLDSGGIVELRRRGHIIGSHSCSHPRRMSSCSWQQLLGEWKQSADILTRIVGEPVTTASVPGGSYSRKVARAAAEAGVRVLFTSEPTTSLRRVDGCWVLGRYAIVRGMSAAAAANLAAGYFLPCLRRRMTWTLKSVLKGMFGDYYDHLRDRCFGEVTSLNGAGKRSS